MFLRFEQKLLPDKLMASDLLGLISEVHGPLSALVHINHTNSFLIQLACDIETRRLWLARSRL